MEPSSLCAAIDEMSRGLVDGDLGGGLFKKRIARSRAGKSTCFRTLIATNRLNRWIFVFGFAKNARSNVDPDEQEALQKLAAIFWRWMSARYLSRAMPENLSR